jgi:hypothetical protein
VGALLPLFGRSVAENPTFSIVPIEGEEFTRRLLTPFEEGKYTLLLRQRFDIDLLLRLMAQELRVKEERGEVSYRNTPGATPEYVMFRRVVSHLSAIQDHNQLHAEPLVYSRHGPFPGMQARLKKSHILSPTTIKKAIRIPSTKERWQIT